MRPGAFSLLLLTACPPDDASTVDGRACGEARALAESGRCLEAGEALGRCTGPDEDKTREATRRLCASRPEPSASVEQPEPDPERPQPQPEPGPQPGPPPSPVPQPPTQPPIVPPSTAMPRPFPLPPVPSQLPPLPWPHKPNPLQ